ncbi:amino acid ABC transporter permease [Thomasclavelia sp.]|uniref:amino acid ABC transporter permease n=1 Tax=Thomasclavelia sp. TaxID=3025757 RepID=UPI0025F55E10|nr:amino acid ABC transporter permease [Thomasclavelia sp.]
MENIFTTDNLIFVLNGLLLTLEISITTIITSLIFGTLLALMRTYGNKLVKIIATIYIEFFRNTPNLLWILLVAFSVTFVDSPYLKGVFSFTLFTSAVVAEVIRGGLNAIDKGQFEAAASQGFNFRQTLWYIIMPQCIQLIVPSLVSQITTIIKDTSYLSQVATPEFLWQCKVIMGSVTVTSTMFVIFGSIAFTYFVINFSISLLARMLQTSNHLARG